MLDQRVRPGEIPVAASADGPCIVGRLIAHGPEIGLAGPRQRNRSPRVPVPVHAIDPSAQASRADDTDTAVTPPPTSTRSGPPIPQNIEPGRYGPAPDCPLRISPTGAGANASVAPTATSTSTIAVSCTRRRRARRFASAMSGSSENGNRERWPSTDLAGRRARRQRAPVRAAPVRAPIPAPTRVARMGNHGPAGRCQAGEEVVVVTAAESPCRPVWACGESGLVGADRRRRTRHRLPVVTVPPEEVQEPGRARGVSLALELDVFAFPERHHIVGAGRGDGEERERVGVSRRIGKTGHVPAVTVPVGSEGTRDRGDLVAAQRIAADGPGVIPGGGAEAEERVCRAERRRDGLPAVAIPELGRYRPSARILHSPGECPDT